MNIPLQKSIYDSQVAKLRAKYPGRLGEEAVAAYSGGWDVRPDSDPVFRPFVIPSPAPAGRPERPETPRSGPGSQSGGSEAMVARLQALRIAHPAMTLSEARATAARQLLEEGDPVRLTMVEEALLPQAVKSLYRAQFEGDPEYVEEPEVPKTPQQKLVANEGLTDDEWKSLGIEPPTEYDAVAAKAAAEARDLDRQANAEREAAVQALVKGGHSLEQAQALTIPVEVFRTRLSTAPVSESKRLQQQVRDLPREALGLPGAE